MMMGEMMGERHGFRGEGGLDLGGFGLSGFLRGEVVVVEDWMLRKMRDISTLNKEEGEDGEEDEKEEEVELSRQDRKRTCMIPISLTTHAQDYCCCLPACHVCLNGRAALYSHPSFVRPSFKEDNFIFP